MRQSPLLSSVVLAVAFAGAWAAPSRENAAAAGAEPKVSYLREVRPILAQYCFECHGPDEATREEDLRLDLREHAFEARGSKAVIAAGAPERSLAWLRMTSDNPSKRMPPAEQAKQPSAAEIETVRLWIEQGANWEDHWAFVPPVKPAPTKVANTSWVRDPLDGFVLAQLERAQLAPAPEASREAWLRRASFDLTGLPPTPAEIDAFLADTRPDAYEREAERLLASPRYGERMAQEWLDLARYADTSGYQNDTPRSIWKWREWVIEAFNSNLSYDRFTIEQLAGDLLPNATLAQKIATGFNRNHPTNSEAGEEEDEYRSAYVIDRVNTTATVFMGLTLACTQCHDHKYDPLSQRDYYAFYSFFNNIKERDSDGRARPVISAANPDQVPRLEDLKRRIDVVKARLEQDDPLADVGQREWELRTLASLGAPIEWTTLEPAGLLARNGSLLHTLEDGSILSGGLAPVKDTYDVMLRPGKRRITAVRLEVLPDPSQPLGALGRASDGRFILSALELRNSTLSESEEPPLVYITSAQADLNQKPKEDPAGYDMTPGSIEGAIVVEPVGAEGKGGGFSRGFGRGWSIVDDERKLPHEAVLLPMDTLETNEASVLRLSLHHTSSSKFKSLIGRFRISVTDDERLRAQLLPLTPKLWSAIGPFAAADAESAYKTAFAVEKDLGAKPLDLKKSYEKIVLEPKPAEGGDKPAGKGEGGEKPAGKGGEAPVAKAEAKPAEKAAENQVEKPSEKAVGKPDAAAPSADAPADVAKADGKPEQDKSAEGKPLEGKAGETQLAAAKPEGGKTAEVKPTDGKPTQGKFDDAKSAEAKPAAEKPGEGKSVAEPKPPAEKIEWTEHRTWRDGDAAKLEGANVAWYVTRKVLSTRARTAFVELDGPAGVKLWINGELAHSAAPQPTPAPEAKPAEKAGEKPGEGKGKEGAAKESEEDPIDESESDAQEEFDFKFGGGESSKGSQRFRVGLREGVNEFVVKLVFAGDARGGEGRGRRGGAGGGSFTFKITPEGDDLLTYEVVQALRKEAQAALEPVASSGASSAPVSTNEVATAATTAATEAATEAATAATTAEAVKSPTPAPAAPQAEPGVKGPNAGRVVEAGAGDEPASQPANSAALLDDKKVSKVGELAAPLVTGEEVNLLTPSQRRRKVLREHYRTKLDPIGRVLADELAKLKEEERELKRRVPSTLVMEELDKPRQAYVFVRGLYKNRGENVAPATPAVLPPMDPELPRNRLGLARWLVNGQHPLTARVFVNRIWQQYFGTGLVRSAEDFGVRSELPSHPELLDLLAVEFVEGGWDIKKLHKRIVLSATYRQDSSISPEKLEKDPENRLFSRGPRLRLSAEMVRDNALSVSGLLHEKLGGPSVKPRQPKNAWKTVEGNFASNYSRHGDERQYRRGLYVYWKRGSPYPSMLNFDAVKRDACTVSRATTTTPLQALTLLNDPVYVESAKMLGSRLLTERHALGRVRDPKPEEQDRLRLAYGFRLCTSRAPSERELEILVELLGEQRTHFKAHADEAKALLEVGDARVKDGIDPLEAAAWAGVGAALLNLDATLHRG
ncbi:MAG: DUF1553 domain-containing protein [Planctomycetes bacterium]|nr:DUF1553 domain-containing protein [Planctomycetota bacterium]